MDENYIRESIVNPHAKVVAGYDPVMPTFQGLVSEEQLLQLIAYIKSLGGQQPGSASTTVNAPGNEKQPPASAKPAGAEQKK